MHIARLTAAAVTLAATYIVGVQAQTAPPSPPQSTLPKASGVPSNTGANFATGVGKVRADKNTKVYHCVEDADSGNGAGVLMTEQAAKTSGYKPAGGRSCF